MKKICIVTIFTFIFIVFCGIFDGCSFSTEKDEMYYTVETVDELYSMESNKNYKLLCNIDLQGREWYPVKVEKFDGNDFTISNCFIVESTGGSYTLNSDVYVGFFSKVSKLENLTFENITINVSIPEGFTGCNYCGIAAGETKEVIDVTVKESKAIYTFLNRSITDVGTICGVSSYEYNENGELISRVKNCFVEDVEISIINTKDSYVKVGGIGGDVPTVEDCFVKNTKLKCNNCNNIGGLVGYSYYGIKDSHASECNLEVTTIFKNVTRAGGLIGLCGDEYSDAVISNCASINNIITVNAKQGYNIGGIIGKSFGKITNCLSDSNYLSGTTASLESTIYAGVGGLCGSTDGTITKCISQNNIISGTTSTISTRMFTTGFVVETTASIVNCAVYNNSINGGNKDVFTGPNNMIHYCYIANFGNTSPNINDLPIILAEEWQNILSTIALDDSLWEFNNSGGLRLKILF